MALWTSRLAVHCSETRAHALEWHFDPGWHLALGWQPANARPETAPTRTSFRIFCLERSLRPLGENPEPRLEGAEARMLAPPTCWSKDTVRNRWMGSVMIKSNVIGLSLREKAELHTLLVWDSAVTTIDDPSPRDNLHLQHHQADSILITFCVILLVLFVMAQKRCGAIHLLSDQIICYYCTRTLHRRSTQATTATAKLTQI